MSCQELHKQVVDNSSLAAEGLCHIWVKTSFWLSREFVS